jgi:hypothetical protein
MPRTGLFFLVALLAGAAGIGHTQGVRGITYAEQPAGIELRIYAATWPALDGLVRRLEASERAAVKAELERRVARPTVSDGERNLLAQLEREEGALDAADSLMQSAAEQRPSQYLHPFQQAMIAYARLAAATGALDRWQWQRRTRDAYQRTFDLNPQHVASRYYLAYSYLQTPAIAGGDMRKAFELSDAGVGLGLNEFYVVRADVHRFRSEFDAAFSDYDAAIERKVFKLNSFLAAGAAALERRQPDRAKRYFDWAVYCRADQARTHEGLGDYYVAVNDTRAAVRAYETALQKEPGRASVRDKLATLVKRGRRNTRRARS